MNGKFRREQIKRAVDILKEEYANLDEKMFAGREAIEVFISRMLFSIGYMTEISKKLQIYPRLCRLTRCW